MKLYNELLSLIPDTKRVTTNATVMEHHSGGLTYHQVKLPEVVVYPIDKLEVKKIVTYAAENKTPIAPFGIGSSLEGQAIPQHGGISMDFSLMNKIINISSEDFLAVVQPGVTRDQLNRHLKNQGLFYPVDPGVDATFGGMAATNASGTNSVKYGVTRNQVLGMEVVLANGEMIQIGSKAMKSSSGYSLKDLLIGSEGTLGIFTEITLRLHGIPEHEMVARIGFSSVEEAGAAAYLFLSSGIPFGKLELVDAQTIEAVNKYLDLDIKEGPTLFVECSGSLEEVAHQIKLTEEMANQSGCLSFESDSLGRSKLWEARHKAGFAIAAANPGKQLMSTDVCVPISHLPEAISFARAVSESQKMHTSIFGHVGDGNFHVVLAIDPNNPFDLEKARKINKEIVNHAILVGGTCSGEHGIGTGKKEYLKQEHGESLTLMLAIKKLFDPQSILNPGTLFDKY